VATKEDKTFVAPDEGAHLPVLDIVHKITAGSSGGSLTIEEWGLPPGMMIPPHTHAREDECDFVLEGELTCDVGGEVVVAPANGKEEYHAGGSLRPGLDLQAGQAPDNRTANGEGA
jgi:quercetin dioxygenase-like cupin family protein